jgi:hypothetical protein
MSIQRVLCVTICLFILPAMARHVATAGHGVEDKKHSLTSLSRANSPRALEAGVVKLLSSSQTSELDELVTDPDCAVALAAGWERVCRTLPVEEQDKLVIPDARMISRFLGLLEGRIQVHIPEGWEAAVKSAKAYGQRSVTFSVPRHEDQPSPGHGFLRRAGDRWIVKKESQLIKLPADDGAGPVDYASVEFADSRAYTALYGWMPIPYLLSATDRGSGEIIWSSRVWANGDRGAYTGPGRHFVTIRSTRDKIVVFGLSSFGSAYVEVFDKKTGENRCRFNTANSNELASRK